MTRVLVVTPHQEQRLLIATILRHQGHAVDTLEPVDTTLETTRSVEQYDLIIADVVVLGPESSRPPPELPVPVVVVAGTRTNISGAITDSRNYYSCRTLSYLSLVEAINKALTLGAAG